MLRHPALASTSLCFVLACGCAVQPSGSPLSSATAADGTTGAPMQGDDDGDDSSTGTPEQRLDLPPGGSSSGEGDGTCVSFTDQGGVTRKPADIIFVVDNSPSMLDETHAVRDHLNAFSQQIIDAQIDIRVLLLTAYPNPDAAPEVDTGICIEPPLGGGGCPTHDTNFPIFAHVQQIIGSEHALSKVLSTHETWKPMMRPDSSKHIIVISDDDSFMTAEDFDAQFLALDPSYAGYHFDAIVSTSLCPEAGAVGEHYITLAGMTDGVIGDLCQQEFQPLFDQLSTAVTEGTGLSCVWSMPMAPEGKSIDPESVEVSLELDGAPLYPVRVDGAEGCPPGGHGWYYDDPDHPSTLWACPTTCDALETAMSAELEIDVGCAFVPAG